MDEKWKISTIESLYFLILHKFQNCKFLEIWGSSCAPIRIKKSVVVRRNAHESYEKQMSKKGLNWMHNGLSKLIIPKKSRKEYEFSFFWANKYLG